MVSREVLHTVADILQDIWLLALTFAVTGIRNRVEREDETF